MTSDKLFGEKSGFDIANRVINDLRQYYVYYENPRVKRCVMTKSEVNHPYLNMEGLSCEGWE